MVTWGNPLEGYLITLIGEEMSNENIEIAQIALGLWVKCRKCGELQPVHETMSIHCNAVCTRCCKLPCNKCEKEYYLALKK